LKGARSLLKLGAADPPGAGLRVVGDLLVFDLAAAGCGVPEHSEGLFEALPASREAGKRVVGQHVRFPVLKPFSRPAICLRDH
jgi:hypothetical protein